MLVLPVKIGISLVIGVVPILYVHLYILLELGSQLLQVTIVDIVNVLRLWNYSSLPKILVLFELIENQLKALVQDLDLSLIGVVSLREDLELLLSFILVIDLLYSLRQHQLILLPHNKNTRNCTLLHILYWLKLQYIEPQQRLDLGLHVS